MVVSINTEVDLFTSSRELSTYIIEHFPQPLYPENIGSDDTATPKMYHFLSVDSGHLVRFLEEIEPDLTQEDDYEIRGRDNSVPLRIRINGKVLTDRVGIEAHLQDLFR